MKIIKFILQSIRSTELVKQIYQQQHTVSSCYMFYKYIIIFSEKMIIVINQQYKHMCILALINNVQKKLLFPYNRSVRPWTTNNITFLKQNLLC